jgi:hypothetical protein
MRNKSCSLCKKSGHNKTTCPDKKKPLLTNEKALLEFDKMKTENEKMKFKLKNLEDENEKLKLEINKNNRKKYVVGTPLEILQKLADDIYEEEYQNSFWKDSPLESLDKLKNDLSGKVGELFIESLCKQSFIPHVYDGNSIPTDGTYDIIINKRKIEIKTAKLGKHKTFQHEGLRLKGYDNLLFIDVTPTYAYVTIIPHFNLMEKSKIFEKKAHLRKGTSDVFKFDFTIKDLEILVIKGHTLKLSEETTILELSTFIKRIV